MPHTLEQIFAFLDKQTYTAEVLIVENDSSDRTYEIAQEFAVQRKRLSLFREEIRGKGNAVQRGMLEAKGEYRFLCDADLSMPIEEVNKFLVPIISDHTDLVKAELDNAGLYGAAALCISQMD